MIKDKTESDNIVTRGSCPISVHNRALCEVGKIILIDSLSVGRNFCKDMITISTGAIAIYLGFIRFLIPLTFEKQDLSLLGGLILSTPGFLFLIASVFFALGYLPKISGFSLDFIESVELARRDLLNKRMDQARLGFAFFSLGMLAAIIIIILIPATIR